MGFGELLVYVCGGIYVGLLYELGKVIVLLILEKKGVMLVNYWVD